MYHMDSCPIVAYPNFVTIIGMVWIGIALQPLIFFATNRKFREYTVTVMRCKKTPDAETMVSLGRRSRGTSSIVSRPSRISFADLRALLFILPNTIRGKNLKDRSSNNSNDNLQTVGEVRETMGCFNQSVTSSN